MYELMLIKVWKDIFDCKFMKFIVRFRYIRFIILYISIQHYQITVFLNLYLKNKCFLTDMRLQFCLASQAGNILSKLPFAVSCSQIRTTYSK